jgi:hypothetical protein
MDYYQSENVRLIAETSVKLMPLADEEKLMYAQKLWDWMTKPDVMQKHSSEGLIKLRALTQYAPWAIRKKETLLELMFIQGTILSLLCRQLPHLLTRLLFQQTILLIIQLWQKTLMRMLCRTLELP